MSDQGYPDLAGRVDDPAGHFPYKHDDARTGAARAEMLRSLEQGHTEEEMEANIGLAQAEVDATAMYVEAQAEFYMNANDETRAAERAAAIALQEARQARRAARAQATEQNGEA